MRYTELLDRFWGMKWSKSHNEIILFHYLLYRCSSLGWPDTFSVSNEEIMQTLKCSPNTARAARKALVDTGLICYKQGDGRGGLTFYSFVADDETCEAKKGSSREHLSAERVQVENTFSQKRVQVENTFSQKRVQVENTFSNVDVSLSADDETCEAKKGSSREHLFDEKKEKKQEKKIFPPAPPIKEKKEKKKSAHTIYAHTPMCANGQFTLFSEAPPLKKKRNTVEPHLPKDIEEVVTFFEKYASDKLPDWRTEAELFFYHFDSLGWMGTSNRKIQDWESKANLWISDKALSLKNGEREKQAEIDARNLRSYGRTTGVPKEGGGGKMLPQPRVRECNEQDDTPKDYTKGF